MNINKKIENDTTYLLIDGALDTETTPLLAEEYSAIDTPKLVFDLKDCPYLTSATLRLILVVCKKYGKDGFKVINVNETIENVFHISGFDLFLNYELCEKVKKRTEKIGFVTLLENNVKNFKNKIAYSFLGMNYTWKDIDVGSHIVAHKLAKMGVKKGSHVAIDSPNTINWILTFYAIQKLGAVAVLVNFSLKTNEIAALIEIADITYFCYGAAPMKTKFKDMVATLKGTSPKIKGYLDISPLVSFFWFNRFTYYRTKKLYKEKFDADEPSVVIFTSGSTGRPKAVLNSAYNCINACFEPSNAYEMSSKDRNLALLPCFHIFGLALNLIIPALKHYRSYIPKSIKSEYLVNLIYKKKITAYATVPTLILSLVKAKNFDSKKVSSLRIALLGGATTTESQILMLKEKFANLHVCNVYGMSENPLISITRYVDTIEHTTQTVGKPFSSLQIEIRDPNGNVLKQGESGEICVKCDSMIICYYGLPLDKQVLDTRGFMATGDLGFIDKDGYIHLVGRSKDLIIRGGENISPGEIASEISKLDYISDVKVLGVPHELLGEEVAAALIMKNNAIFNKKEIVSYLSTKLAKYKIPAHYVLFDKFPLLGSGKVDAFALKNEVINRIKAEQK